MGRTKKTLPCLNSCLLVLLLLRSSLKTHCCRFVVLRLVYFSNQRTVVACSDLIYDHCL
uniref:Secreted protein n=1 Tax=Ciona intestinalis TaxID=7719 RepID=H2XRB1_CIOIN